MARRDLIGRVLATSTAEVTAEAIVAFARAVGDLDPLYVDPEAAARGPYGALVAPPTFPIAFMAQSMADGFETFMQLGLDFTTLVHGEQEFEYRRPIKAGERLTLTGRVADVYEKQGRQGMLDFVVIETTGTDAAGELVFVSRQTLISRRQS